MSGQILKSNVPTVFLLSLRFHDKNLVNIGQAENVKEG